MSLTSEETDWPEPGSLAEALVDFTPRGRGRPTKGNEVDHGVDPAWVETRSANQMPVSENNTGLTIRPLAGQPEAGGVRLQKENVRHRVLVYLFAQGGTARNVFEQLGGQWDNEKGCAISGTGEYSYQQLLNIRRQAWFQNEILAVIAESGSPLIEAKLKLEQMASLETLIEIRDNKEEKGATRAACAMNILDRFLGKPAQVVKTESAATTASHENEAHELQEKLRRLEAEAHNLNPAFIPTT
jgi:hypothetical protein